MTIHSTGATVLVPHISSSVLLQQIGKADIIHMLQEVSAFAVDDRANRVTRMRSPSKPNVHLGGLKEDALGKVFVQESMTEVRQIRKREIRKIRLLAVSYDLEALCGDDGGPFALFLFQLFFSDHEPFVHVRHDDPSVFCLLPDGVTHIPHNRLLLLVSRGEEGDVHSVCDGNGDGAIGAPIVYDDDGTCGKLGTIMGDRVSDQCLFVETEEKNGDLHG